MGDNSTLPVRHMDKEEAAAELLCMLVDNISRRKRPDRSRLLAALLELGIFDQLTLLLANSTSTNGREALICIEHIERLIENRYFNTLDLVDPVLRKTTLEMLLRALKDEDDKDWTLNVITIVIFITTIYLIKFDVKDDKMMRQSILGLETIFIYIARYLDELTIGASDPLVRATNGLILAVKSKLDFLIDNDIIRDNFKTLVEGVAEKCLIESHYKNAAMLYSQIEDNVNAIKALMRAGDVDTVTNYALLVRDITVNRITINYLKHLKVDAKQIEEFVARTRG